MIMTIQQSGSDPDAIEFVSVNYSTYEQIDYFDFVEQCSDSYREFYFGSYLDTH